MDVRLFDRTSVGGFPPSCRAKLVVDSSSVLTRPVLSSHRPGLTDLPDASRCWGVGRCTSFCLSANSEGGPELAVSSWAMVGGCSFRLCGIGIQLVGGPDVYALGAQRGEDCSVHACMASSRWGAWTTFATFRRVILSRAAPLLALVASDQVRSPGHLRLILSPARLHRTGPSSLRPLSLPLPHAPCPIPSCLPTHHHHRLLQPSACACLFSPGAIFPSTPLNPGRAAPPVSTGQQAQP